MQSALRKLVTVAAGAALLLGLASGAMAHTIALSGYQVEPGDTLYAIAAKELGSGTRWKELAALNGLTDGSGIRPGQILRLPSGAPASVRRHASRFVVAEPPAEGAPQGDVRIGHGYEASPAPRLRRRYLHRGIEIVPRGRVVMVLPAPRLRMRHPGRVASPVDRADLPTLPGGGSTSPWQLADGMAFLVGAGGTFVFLSRGVPRLLARSAGQRGR